MSEFKDFYIKPAQSSARGSKVYRVSVSQSEAGHTLTIGCPTEYEEEKAVVEKILGVESGDSSIVQVDNLSMHEIARFLVDLSKTISYPIIEEVIPMTESHGSRVEFRVAQIIDRDFYLPESQRCYCKKSESWTAANISLGGSAVPAFETITALVEEHVHNPDENLAAKILEAIFTVAKNFHKAYVEKIENLTALLPENIRPYEIRRSQIPTAIDLGLHLEEDGSFELYLIEAAFNAELSGLESEDPEFVQEFSQASYNIERQYSPLYVNW